jgi:uncharacterized membrane protein
MSHLPPFDYLTSSARWFGTEGAKLNQTARRVLERASRRATVTEDINQRIDSKTTYGQRLADKVAAFGGSWTFIIVFVAILVAWVVLNSLLLGRRAVDPYPYIFLNLMLSMLAAFQAPVIMMSQNRQSSKDREMAAYDYEVNLKAEVEILALHEKLDSLRNEQVVQLLAQQQAQIDLLTRLIKEGNR